MAIPKDTFSEVMDQLHAKIFLKEIKPQYRYDLGDDLKNTFRREFLGARGGYKV